MHSYNLFTNAEESLEESKLDLLLFCDEEYEKETLDTLLQQSEYLYSGALITHTIQRVEGLSKSTLKSVQKSSDAQEIFRRGMNFGSSYELQGNALIIGYITNHSSTHVQDFLSSFEDAEGISTFEKLSDDSYTLALFCAGFLLEATRRFNVILGGEVDMAFTLFIADILRGDVLMRLNSQNVTFVMSRFTKEQEHILTLLQKLSYNPRALYIDYSLQTSEIQEIQDIETTPLRECAAASAMLLYAQNCGLEEETLVNELEISTYLL
ncbi:MAG: hypothetical protein JXQ67_06540 [Campylobacterales bacterium]|nr:hypothetical protein [Campylobacterales bacterium]